MPVICGRSEKMPMPKPSAKSRPLEIRVRNTIKQHRMLSPGEHVLVAASGGADSTALLVCLHKLAARFPLSLTAAHLNHRIRGAEADEDETFVRKMCADLGIPFVSETLDVKRQAAEAKQNLEEFARRTRYDFLRRTARRVKAQKIAVGHNLNDQAETALFRFVRGSGLEGLSAIYPVVDGLIVRPLLECTRESIREYLKREGVPFREDSSNADLRYSRNRIRQELMPFLEKHFNPRLVQIIARETSIARETWSFMQDAAKEAFQRLQSRSGDGLSLSINKLLELHPALQKQVIRQALKALLGSLGGITAAHIDGILALGTKGRSGSQVRIPGGCAAIRQFDELLLRRSVSPATPSFAYGLKVPGRCRIPEAGIRFVCTIGVAPSRKVMRETRSSQAFLEPSRLPRSLLIRPRTPGDRYGGPGHRKVKKMLITGKIPQLHRPSLPMIVAGNDVIWIPGFRAARGYEAKPDSSECVCVEMISL